MESLASGTPVVAFNSTGTPSMIVQKFNGYLAKPFSTKDFANGINWALKEKKNKNLKVRIRNYSEKIHNSKLIAKQYINTYNELLFDKKIKSA